MKLSLKISMCVVLPKSSLPVQVFTHRWCVFLLLAHSSTTFSHDVGLLSRANGDVVFCSSDSLLECWRSKFALYLHRHFKFMFIGEKNPNKLCTQTIRTLLGLRIVFCFWASSIYLEKSTWFLSKSTNIWFYGINWNLMPKTLIDFIPRCPVQKVNANL